MTTEANVHLFRSQRKWKRPISCIFVFRQCGKAQAILVLEPSGRLLKTTAVRPVGKSCKKFTEVESGKLSDRPELKAALAACRATGATLLIAKLDRLARNVHFLSGLLESGVRCVAAGMPNADRFMLHVYAAMAEEEGRRISERTRAALAAAKAHGVRLGQTAERLAEINRDCADRFASKLGPMIRGRIEHDNLTLRAVAARLNEMKVAPARDGQWHATTVHRVHHRFMATA